MMVNPFNGRRSRGSHLAGLGLIAAAAVVLSTVTVLGLHWAVAQKSTSSAARSQETGFVRLDRPAPAVSLPSLAGRGTISLAGLAGKPIVLNFWSSTCLICKKETPALASVARAAHGQVRFLGVDSADFRGPARAFAARYRVPYPSVFDPSATAAAAYGIGVLPVTFFLSRSGTRILGVNTGALTPPALRAILRELYGVA